MELKEIAKYIKDLKPNMTEEEYMFQASFVKNVLEKYLETSITPTILDKFLNKKEDATT
jgi:hypothetical protein